MDTATKQVKVKVANIEAQFPELVSKNMYQYGRGRASSARLAIARAFADVLRKPAVRGHRISTIKATITVATVLEEREVKPKRWQLKPAAEATA